MPAIKLKKATQEYLAEKEREKEAKAAASLAAAAPPPPPPVEEPPAPKAVKPKAKFLEAEVLFEKRKRTIPPAELRAGTWLDDNLEVKEGINVSLVALYDYYTETCVLEEGKVVDVPVFNRLVKDKFGKDYGIKEDSALKGLVKDRKHSDKKPKVQAESLNLKMKDILEEIINEAKNPNRGLRFQTLKKNISAKYPALQLDMKPQKLLSALNRGLSYGHLELVRGTGKCGFYRLPGESTAEEDMKKETKEKEKKQKKDKTDKENDGTAAEGEEDKGDDVPEKEPEKEHKSKKGRKRKRKSEESEAKEDGEKKEEEAKEEEAKEAKEAKEGEAKEGEDGEAPKKKTRKSKKNKDKKKKNSKKSAWRGTASMHSDPQSVSDTFSLAITYMSDPKDASITKIKKYIADHYPDSNMDTKLKKALEKGAEKGIWEQVSGSGGTGKFRLLAEDFNPSEAKSMEDMVCQAIVACHEPKQASAGLIKKYIIEYHPEFGIDNKPHLYKGALKRACLNKKIKQLSGIGASGSFQLVSSFYPSPAILAGDADAEAEEAAVEREDDNEEVYQEMYVVRKTKSGRGGIPVTVLAKKQRRR
ncbi:heterochromatin protein 1-binding protein 3-like [Mizuhopecten yessoensis]|uniref:Heterochromatin protein 1-binding protein 3 n=1 Tax=Mizuhopecten yessoensis TaxID=6573 RepID=A0A210QT05_MIZYE|nr:heterochromatin protein 1-binding protein 3-like [Mizuhopecten yessoensis]OWF51861.1 Heterochromatin protein 1-binding protein 3 [Mizuhopecten yessoensis]